DVRAIGDADGTARYVTKYVTKPAHESVYADREKLDEMLLALRGRRLWTTFGGWRKWDLDAAPADAGEWHPIAPLADLATRAKSGDLDAQRWCAAAARKWPLLAECYGWTALLAELRTSPDG